MHHNVCRASGAAPPVKLNSLAASNTSPHIRGVFHIPVLSAVRTKCFSTILTIRTRGNDFCGEFRLIQDQNFIPPASLLTGGPTQFPTKPIKTTSGLQSKPIAGSGELPWAGSGGNTEPASLGSIYLLKTQTEFINFYSTTLMS